MQFIGRKQSFIGDAGKDITHIKELSQIENIAELLLDPEKYLPRDGNNINVFVTVAHVTDMKSRTTTSQETLPFDFDKIDLTRWEEYLAVFEKVTGITKENYFCIQSGSGLHIGVWLTWNIGTADYAPLRKYYIPLCMKLEEAIRAEGLTIKEVDSNMLSSAKMYRVPLSINRKDGVNRDVKLLHAGFTHCDFPLAKLGGIAGVADLHDDASISVDAYSRITGQIDRKAMLNECLFLKHCYDHQEEVNEPQWFAMLNLVYKAGTSPDEARTLCHEYSNKHPKYTAVETDNKLGYISFHGPRRCMSVQEVFPDCIKCPHYGKIESPIFIKGEDFIKTEHTGFYDVEVKNGIPKSGQPVYEDLRRYFEKKNNYIIDENSKVCFIFNGKCWEEFLDIYIESFAQDNFKPVDKQVMTAQIKEFAALVRRTNVKCTSFFDLNSMSNLDNGVYDVRNKSFIPHNINYGFRNVLPYSYDPSAKCPLFDKYISEVTCKDKLLETILLEYIGCCLFNEDPEKIEKALILLGEGSNGKSVFCDLVTWLTGPDNFSTVAISNLGKPAHAVHIRNKLVNISEEAPSNRQLESNLFKTLVTGGYIDVHMYYKGVYQIKNTAKLIVTANSLPTSDDGSHGLFRRLLIVPFNATFNKNTRDIHIREKLKSELSGIFNRVKIAFEDYKVRGKFTDSDVVDAEVMEYQQSTNPLQAWKEECLEPNDSGRIEVMDLYPVYLSWCEKYKQKNMEISAFSRSLKYVVPDNSISRKRTSSKRLTYIHGFRINEVKIVNKGGF